MAAADETPEETPEEPSAPAEKPAPAPVAPPAPQPADPAPVADVQAETVVAPKETPQERAERIGWVRRELKNVSGLVMKWPHARLRHQHDEVHSVVLPADQSVPAAMESLSCAPCNQDGSELEPGVIPTEHQAAAVEAQAAKE